MKSFKQYLFESIASPEIKIDLEVYKKEIKDGIDSLIDYIKEKEDRLKSFKLDTEYVKKHLKDYPNSDSFIKNLNSSNSLYDEYKRYFEWKTKDKDYEKEYAFRRHIFDHLDKLKKFNASNEISYYKNDYTNLIHSTIKNSKILEDMIKRAITNLDWNTRKIIIEAQPSIENVGAKKKEVSFTPATTFQVSLVSEKDSKYSPSFTAFFKDDMTLEEVDDVLDGGDSDFFDTPQIQADYFSLIKELKNPGSTKTGRILNLYTARPKKDRNMYFNAKTLPANIFLTDTYSHVEGLALDLAEKNEPRDIWKVKISERYLVKTLDGPVKYYQVIKDNAPVEYMSLLNPAN